MTALHDDGGRHAFAGNPLDRLAEWRTHEEWFHLTLTHANTVVVPVWDSQVLVRQGDRCEACLLPGREAAALVQHAAALILLGRRDQRTYVAVDLASRHAATEAQRLAGARFVDLKPVGALLPGDDAAVLAYARAMAHWHATRGTAVRAAARPSRASPGTCGAARMRYAVDNTFHAPIRPSSCS